MRYNINPTVHNHPVNKKMNKLAKPKKPKPQSQIHIAIIIDSWFPGPNRVGVVGGGQVHVKEITKRIQEKNPVTFSLFFPGNKFIIYRLLWPAIALIRILELHKKNPIHLIHSHSIMAAIIGKLASQLTKVPQIHTVHGSHLLDLHSSSPFAWIQNKILTKTTYQAQISVSKSFQKYKNVNSKLFIIPNGVDVADFDAIKVTKNQDPTIIWVGRNHPLKGLSYLREAIAKVRKKYPNLKTKFITGGQLRGTALIKAYKRAHMFVLPSLAEGQPITLLEAWAAKLPVIATAVGDNPVMVKSGENGYLVEPASANQLAHAIQKILRARTADAKMGEAGYTMVKKHYTWDKTAAKTWKVYQAVLKANQPI
jgi:glycosyltransferase involved in cell wall biosynthesis